MRRKILFTVALVVLGWTATARAAPRPGFSRGEERELPAASESPPSVLEKSAIRELAYTNRRWVGLLSKGVDTCPPIEGWTSTPLQNLSLAPDEVPSSAIYIRTIGSEGSPPIDPKAKAADEALLRKLGLDRFCIFTNHDPRQPFPSHLPRGLIAVRDRMVLSTLDSGGELPGGISEPQIWKTLSEQFLEQAGGTTAGSGFSLPQRADSPDQPPGPDVDLVRLTFLDSQPDGWFPPVSPASGTKHGYSLEYLAHELVCPGGKQGDPKEQPPCAATIWSRQALRYDHFDQNQGFPATLTSAGDPGGHMGLLSDLAIAIEREVWNWRRQPESHRPKLILNISLGWDGKLFGDLTKRRVSDLEPSAQAVYRALQFAIRRGVLVIASAGNRKGGQEISSGLLLPAAWELRRPSWFPFNLGRRPIYAVGGIDAQGLPISNSRRGAHPRLAAYSDHAVAIVTSPDTFTGMYTGTSVSAAVASSIAAVVWHLRPGLTAAQVMKLLDRSAEILKGRADYYGRKVLWPLPRPHVRRLTLCKAITEACRPGPAACSGLTPLVCAQPQGPVHLPPPSTPPPSLASVDFRPSRSLSCEGQTDSHMEFFPAGGQDGTRCPLPLGPEATSHRWLCPQPDSPPCPSCVLEPHPPTSQTAATLEGYDLVPTMKSDWKVRIDPELPPVLPYITSAALVLECYENGKLTERKSYEIPARNVFTLLAGTPLFLSGLHGGLPLDGCTAALDFQVKATGKVSVSLINPVAISPLAPTQ